jgi:hypothetical protein
MNESFLLIIALVLIVVFFILAIVVIFRFDSVKNTFEGLGFKLGISGTKKTAANRDKENNRSEEKDSQESGSKAAVNIHGKVSSGSLVNAIGSQSSIKVGKDVLDSDLNAKGDKSAKAEVAGDVKNSSIKAQAKK